MGGRSTFMCWRVKRATRVLNVLWPCKYLPVINCRQTLCRSRYGPLGKLEKRRGDKGGVWFVHYRSSWFPTFDHFSGRQQQIRESDKAKKGKLLSALMRALLPVWESLVMLGPDSGGMWREGRGRWGKRGRQENWQGCRRHRKCHPPPLCSWSTTGW